MSTIREYKDIVAVHPGCYIEEFLEGLGIDPAEAAKRAGTTEETIRGLVNGEVNLSEDLAGEIAGVLGTSQSVLMTLQRLFDQKVQEIEKAKSAILPTSPGKSGC